MTPKEKAEDLLNAYWIYLRANLMYDDEAKEDAKQCALVAVDEVLHSLSYKMSSNIEELDYYNEVKKEIEKL